MSEITRILEKQATFKRITMETFRNLNNVDAAVESKHPKAVRLSKDSTFHAQWEAAGKVVAEAKLTETGRWRLKIN